jgi:hypothetical protein
LAGITFLLFLATLALWLATQRLVRSAEKTARAQLRAYVFGKGFESGTNREGEIFGTLTIREYLVCVIYENVGFTPAIDFHNWIDIQTFPMNEDRNPIFSPRQAAVSIPMGPRATATSRFVAIPLETIIQKWHNETEILVWSRAEYRDAFDPNIIRHHEQCAFVEVIHEPSTLPPPNHLSYIRFPVYGPQNSSS